MDTQTPETEAASVADRLPRIPHLSDLAGIHEQQPLAS